jgi:hypothetical protein
MAQPGEYINATRTTCFNCGTELAVKVCVSAAGHYVGFFCPNCGPYSRESGYFHSREEAEQALHTGNYGR